MQSAAPTTLYPHFISGRPLLEQAYNMASEAHGAMVRKGDGSPYLNHPVRVAAALWRCQLDEAVVAAGFLHDIVEDTPTPLSLTYKSVSVRM